MPRTSAVTLVTSHVRRRGKCNELGVPMPILSGKRCRAQAKRDEDLVEHAPLRDQTLAAHETSVAHRKRRGRNLSAGEKEGMFGDLVRPAKGKVPAKIGEILEAACVAENYLRQSLVPQAKDKTRTNRV